MNGSQAGMTSMQHSSDATTMSSMANMSSTGHSGHMTTAGHGGHAGHMTTASHAGHMTTGGHGGHGSTDVGSGGHEVGMMDMGMKMYFSLDWNQTYVLFEKAQLTETWHLAVACLVVALVACLYEGLKVFREHLLLTYNQSASREVSGYEGSKDGIVNVQPNTVGGRMCTWVHYLQTFLHMVQVTVSYALMLVFMTYQVWLCISVILGAGLGYFLFGWKRAIIVDSNEHCH